MDVRRALRRAHLRNIQPARHSALLSSGRTPSEPAQVGEAREGTSPSVAGAGVSVVKGGVRKAATCASVSGVGDASAADDAAAPPLAAAAAAAGPAAAQKDTSSDRLEDLERASCSKQQKGCARTCLGHISCSSRSRSPSPRRRRRPHPRILSQHRRGALVPVAVLHSRDQRVRPRQVAADRHLPAVARALLHQPLPRLRHPAAVSLS